MIRLPLACAVALSLAAAPVFAGQVKPGASPVAPQAASPQAAAPTPGSDEWLRQRGESYSAAPDSAQNPDELAATSKLNASIAASAEAAERADAAAQAAFDAETDQWREDTARNSTARAQWEADVAASEAARRQWERDQAAWEAEVAACRRSNRTCIAPPAPTAPK